MPCVLGGKQKSKMAEEIVKRFPELSSYSSVAKKNKNELRKICRILGLTTEYRATFEGLSLISGSSARQSIPKYII